MAATFQQTTTVRGTPRLAIQIGEQVRLADFSPWVEDDFPPERPSFRHTLDVQLVQGLAEDPGLRLALHGEGCRAEGVNCLELRADSLGARRATGPSRCRHPVAIGFPGSCTQFPLFERRTPNAVASSALFLGFHLFRTPCRGVCDGAHGSSPGC